MNRFQKIVAIEPIHLPEEQRQALFRYAESVILFPDIPADNREIVRRIGDADAVLLSYTSNIGREVLSAAQNVRYIGMCCSLYAPESANVDILFAKQRGIEVTGVRDYGDEGVPEYVIGALSQLLHGFGGSPMWRDFPAELTGIPAGVLGLGTSGQAVARALHFFGAKVHYYSRTRKPEIERDAGYLWLPLPKLLAACDILCCCLNKNVILLHRPEFDRFGDGKILVNTSIGPAFDLAAAAEWLGRPGNFLLGDSEGAIGGETLLSLPNVLSAGKSAGMTSLARVRLGEKVLQNIGRFLAGTPCAGQSK